MKTEPPALITLPAGAHRLGVRATDEQFDEFWRAFKRANKQVEGG